MRFAIAILGLSSFLVACGPSEEDFAVEYTGIICDLTFDCTDEELIEYLPWADANECKTASEDGEEAEESTCNYDKAAAAECLEAASAMTCDDYNAGSFPSSCSNVCPE